MLNTIIFCTIVVGIIIFFNLKVKKKSYILFMEAPFDYNLKIFDIVNAFGTKEMEDTVKKELIPFFRSVSKQVSKSGDVDSEKLNSLIHKYKKNMLPMIEDFYMEKNFNEYERENIISFLKDLDTYAEEQGISLGNNVENQDRKLALLGMDLALVLVLTKMFLKGEREKDLLLYDIRTKLPLSDYDIEYITS